MLPLKPDADGAFTVAAESARTGDAERLLRSAEDELRARYPDYEPTPMQPEVIEPDDAALFVARIEGVAVGCIVGLPWSENEEGIAPTAELKRLWVRPEVRGRGIAKALLTQVETWAHGTGYQSVVLETGIGQPEALRLYPRCGYGQIVCWGEYAEDEVSVCFAKPLLQGT